MGAAGKAKVCHMTSAHPPEDIRIFRKECVSLAKAGYDVYLVEPGGTYEKDNVHIIGVGPLPGSRRERMASFSKKVYKAALSVDADIYHFHDPELLPYGLKLKKRGKRVIFDSHEKYTEQIKTKEYLPAPLRSLIAFAYGAYERHALRKIDGLVFPCLKDGRNPFEGQCRRIAFLDNVPLLEELYDYYDPDSEKWDRSVCCLGSLTRARGITQLVRAASMAGAEVYLAGNFSPDSYQEEVLSMPEASCVHYMGRVSREDVRKTLSHCRIGAAVGLNVGQYNKFDNLATKSYEYMAMGLPSIMAKSPYCDKLLSDYCFAVCIDPEDVEAYASAIRYLLDHPKEARQMGEAGRRAVQEKFNWGVEETKLLALYEEKKKKK